MTIKSHIPIGKSPFKQGIFPISENSKYRGKMPVIFRSSWEYIFMRWCVNNPEVKWWSSESVQIPYVSPLDGRVHTYYPDFLVGLENKTLLVEIKPYIQTVPPKQNGKETAKQRRNRAILESTVFVNLAKKEAAMNWAKSRGMEYVIVTEKWFEGK